MLFISVSVAKNVNLKLKLTCKLNALIGLYCWFIWWCLNYWLLVCRWKRTSQRWRYGRSRWRSHAQRRFKAKCASKTKVFSSVLTIGFIVRKKYLYILMHCFQNLEKVLFFAFTLSCHDKNYPYPIPTWTVSSIISNWTLTP